MAKQGCARLVIVNAEQTPYDDIADAMIRDPIGEVLPFLVDSASGSANATAE